MVTLVLILATIFSVAVVTHEHNKDKCTTETSVSSVQNPGTSHLKSISSSLITPTNP